MLKAQLEQIFNEQDKLKAEFEKAKSEYLQNSALVSMRRQSLIIKEIEKFIDLHYIRNVNARCNVNEFRINFESFINYDIHDLLRILVLFGYIRLEQATDENITWTKPYIKGFESK